MLKMGRGSWQLLRFLFKYHSDSCVIFLFAFLTTFVQSRLYIKLFSIFAASAWRAPRRIGLEIGDELRGGSKKSGIW